MKVDLDTLQALQKLAFEMTADQGLAESIGYSVFNLDPDDEDVSEQVSNLANAILSLVSKEIDSSKKPAQTNTDMVWR